MAVVWWQCLGTLVAVGLGSTQAGSSTAACPGTGLFSVLAQAHLQHALPLASQAARSHLHIPPLVRETKTPLVLRVLAKLKVSLAETNPTPVKPEAGMLHWTVYPFCSRAPVLMGAVLPTLSAHLLQELPVPFPHLSCKPSGHLTHLLKPNDLTEDLGELQGASQAGSMAPPARDGEEQFLTQGQLWQQPGGQISQSERGWTSQMSELAGHVLPSPPKCLPRSIGAVSSSLQGEAQRCLYCSNRLGK